MVAKTIHIKTIQIQPRGKAHSLDHFAVVIWQNLIIYSAIMFYKSPLECSTIREQMLNGVHLFCYVIYHLFSFLHALAHNKSAKS